MEYTYDDILTPKDILTGKVKKEDIIGKRGWFTNNICPLQEIIINGKDPDFLLLHGAVCFIDEYYRFASSSHVEHMWNYFLPEKEESAPNLRFKVGDKVFYNGKTTEVIEADETDRFLPYLILFDGIPLWVTDSELETDEPKLREKTYEERQAEWIKANNIKEGDKVKILRKAEPLEGGWGDIWVGNEVGKIGVIDVIHSGNIRVMTNTENHWYPYFVLEKVEDKLPDDIHELDISVFSSLETIWEMERSLCPRIKGYTVNDSGEFVAFDNTAGEFFVEDFDTREKAISWLNGTGTKEEAEAKDKPEYAPFDLSDKKVRDELRGKWIIPKGHSDSIEKQITLFGSQMTGYGKIWCVDMDITPDKLLASWTFLDGTPCGQQMASK